MNINLTSKFPEPIHVQAWLIKATTIIEYQSRTLTICNTTIKFKIALLALLHTSVFLPQLHHLYVEILHFPYKSFQMNRPWSRIQCHLIAAITAYSIQSVQKLC